MQVTLTSRGNRFAPHRKPGKDGEQSEFGQRINQQRLSHLLCNLQMRYCRRKNGINVSFSSTAIRLPKEWSVSPKAYCTIWSLLNISVSNHWECQWNLIFFYLENPKIRMLTSKYQNLDKKSAFFQIHRTFPTNFLYFFNTQRTHILTGYQYNLIITEHFSIKSLRMPMKSDFFWPRKSKNPNVDLKIPKFG